MERMNILLIDNDASRIQAVKDALNRPADGVLSLETAGSLEEGLSRINTGGINAVMMCYGMFGEKLYEAVEKIKNSATGIGILAVVGRAEEDKAAERLVEAAGDFLIMEELSGYIAARAVRQAMDRNVLMLELEQYTREFMSSEERFRNIIANNADAMVVLNADRAILFANFAAEKLFRRKAQEMAGTTFQYPVKAGTVTELKVERSGAEPAVAEMKVVETEWEGEKAFIASLRDETERKKAEEENAKLQKQLIQGEKLMSVGMLASGVAHEINNPLTIILGFMQIMMRHAKPEDPNYPHYKEVESAALRCKKIVSQLLTFSHQGEFSFDPIDVNQAVENSLDLVGFQLESSNISVIKKLAAETLTVMGSMQQLEQVFINIITNAKDAMPGGGTLEISTGFAGGPGGEKMVEAVFKDSGTGIAKEDISKVFDPFFTTKTVGKGTGLGLSVCVGIIDKLGGKIAVESEPGKGTSFTIRLPLRE